MPSSPRFSVAEIARHVWEGWEQPRCIGDIFAARSQVFPRPFSPNTAGMGPAETSRSREPDHNRSSAGRGWETWGRETRGRSPRLAVQGRRGSAAQPGSQVSPCHAWAEALTLQSPLSLCCRSQSHPGALLARGPRGARLDVPPKPPPVPQLRGKCRLATCMSHFLYFCLKHPHSSVPQIPPDEPTDPAHQPTGISDAASPPRPPGTKGLKQISLRNQINSATSPPCPSAHAPRPSC